MRSASDAPAPGRRGAAQVAPAGPALAPLPLLPRIRDRIAAHAEETYPREACGLLIGSESRTGDVVVVDAVPVPNRAADPLRAFRLDPDLGEGGRALASDGPGARIVGAYHSHPDRPPVPSNEDLAAAAPGLWYVAVSVRGGRALGRSAWRGRAPCPR